MRRLVAMAVLVLAAPAAATAADPLAAKAEAFHAALHERHLSPEGFVLYRVDLRSIGRQLASGEYPENADGPTFTGLFAGAACARAESASGTAREQALADATLALRGLEIQSEITETPGLLARTVRRAPPHRHARGVWFPGSGAYSGWYWRGNASLDQYANGLVPAIGLCRRLFPERARALATGASDHLLAHDFHLTDPDGKPTRFGDLSWRSGYGLNSIAQLTSYALFSLAAELDADPKYRAWRDRLRDEYRVVARARTTNLRVFGVTNHSNDLMAFNLYRVLVPVTRESGDPAAADLRHGLWRSWLRVRDDGNAYFDLVFCELEREACDPAVLARARTLLGAFPLEKRKLSNAAAVADIPARLIPGRKWKTLASEIVPIEKRPASSFEWKSSPYRLERGAHPHTEYTGLDYLVAYWLYASVCESRSDCPAS